MKLAEIPDNSTAVCLGSLTLTPGCTSWLIWSSPSGFGPNKQTQTDTVDTQTQNCFGSAFIFVFLQVGIGIISTRKHNGRAPRATVKPNLKF